MQEHVRLLKEKLNIGPTASGERQSGDLLGRDILEIFKTTVYLLDYWTSMILIDPAACQ